MVGTWLNSVLKYYAQCKLKCVYISDVVKVYVKNGNVKVHKTGGTPI